MSSYKFCVLDFFGVFSFSVCSSMRRGDYFSNIFPDLKWIFEIGRNEYETVVPSSILYMGFSTLLLGFGTSWVGN